MSANFKISPNTRVKESFYSFPNNAVIQSSGRFSPKDVKDLALWFMADSGITDAGGGAVSQWDDLSGNNNHLIGAAGSRPIITSNILNGLPVVRFTAASSHYLTLTTPITLNAFTMYFVYNKVANANYGIIFGSSNVYTNMYLPLNYSDGTTFFSTTNAAATIFASGHATSMAINRFMTPGSTGIDMYKNRVKQTLSSGGTNTLPSNPYLYMGRMFHSSGAYWYFNGDISEVILINRPIPAYSEEDSNMLSYLSRKDAITLS